MKNGIKNELVNAIDFPKEVLLNLPKITLIGKPMLLLKTTRELLSIFLKGLG